jgi:hypothetical protein
MFRFLFLGDITQAHFLLYNFLYFSKDFIKSFFLVCVCVCVGSRQQKVAMRPSSLLETNVWHIRRTRFLCLKSQACSFLNGKLEEFSSLPSYYPVSTDRAVSLLIAYKKDKAGFTQLYKGVIYMPYT